MCRDRLVVFPLSFFLGLFLVLSLEVLSPKREKKENNLLGVLEEDTLEVDDTLEQADIESPSDESASSPCSR